MFAKHISEYHEDYGPVLWWTYPITEAPYSGSTLDTDFPAYLEWWTPLPECPNFPDWAIKRSAHDLWTMLTEAEEKTRATSKTS